MALVIYSDKIEIITPCSSSREFLDRFSSPFLFFPPVFFDKAVESRR